MYDDDIGGDQKCSALLPVIGSASRHKSTDAIRPRVRELSPGDIGNEPGRQRVPAPANLDGSNVDGQEAKCLFGKPLERAHEIAAVAVGPDGESRRPTKSNSRMSAPYQ